MLDWLYRTFWANVLRKALTVCGAAVVLGGAVFAVTQVLETLDRCAAGVERSEGECVGVNGSGYDFGTSEISAVSRAIAEENDRVAKQPHITVALMLPLQPAHEAGRQQLRSDVQGAYLAQYRANRQEKSPRLRLVLANPGSGYEQQEKVVDRLAELADSPEANLRAVTGFNLSLASTKDAMERLTNELEIPVLASRVSADALANPEGGGQRFDGLARVIPTNRQQAAALADFYGDLKDRETVLVKDTRPRDIYVKS
ncbi:hypothetical protein [Streptomyces oceani]|uniref:hypothetical protein n=1 Tax=Streptomyces oceani TaxID=1075402 RepID=UPI000B33E1F4|nr:hypothetical protein [Streptomyces oceani]